MSPSGLFVYIDMSHYYTNDDVISKESSFTFTYKNHDIKLICDHGVFSRNRVDYGTRVLLDTIDIKEAESLLDVGCGYGPIGISLKKEYSHLKVDMIDVNERAIYLALKNSQINDLENINAFKSNIYENIHESYDLILTNPPIRAGKNVVSTILKESINHLNQKGRIVVVIQKKQGAPSAKKLLEETFGNCKVLNRDKGYYVLEAVK